MGNESLPSKRRLAVAVYLLCAFVYLGFGLEVLGILLTDKNLDPVLKHHRFFFAVEISTLALTLVSPGLALGAFTMVAAAAREMSSTTGRILIWVIVILGFLVSLAEAMWTCSGHPTWIKGYPGF
jgi:hypothetical protein